jgi:hypothetical protein
MMPGDAYGANWLKVVDQQNKLLGAWPNAEQSALEHIYLQPKGAWWRLLNPEWVNPGGVNKGNGGGLGNVQKRLVKASEFLHSIERTFQPLTYASYCASPNRNSYGEVVFKIVADTDTWGAVDTGCSSLPPPESWKLLSDDAKGKLTVQAAKRIVTLQLQPASAAGDETVPSHRSAKRIFGTLFVHGAEDKGYEHQNSYADPQVLVSMLYSIVQIAKTAKWR